MEIIRRSAYARAGLIGNPSDGYKGKTISFTMKNFCATAVMYEWEEVELLPSQEDQSKFGSIEQLADDVDVHGYYGGLRLVKATIKRFVDYCRLNELTLKEKNFSIRYESDIPRAVGLAGSSAIIVATLRCLMDFYEIEIPMEIQPTLALSVETHELGISAGLQDRVIQVYEGLVAMDFSDAEKRSKNGFDYWKYERLDPKSLPPVYIAFSEKAGQPTEVFHNNLKTRYDNGDRDVHDAIARFVELTSIAKQSILEGDEDRLFDSIDRNFDTRASIVRLPKEQVQMIEAARQSGVCAKFAGSGGAVVGLCSEENWTSLKDRMERIGATVIRPVFH